MIRPIMKDVNFLSKKSVVATKADLAVANDLVDTLRANLDGCVGMAANMIGVQKRIIDDESGHREKEKTLCNNRRVFITNRCT